MVNTYDATKTVAVPDEDNYSWALYGKESHTVDIDVRNYLDELRINEKDIEYKISLNGKTPVYDDNGELTGYEEADETTLGNLVSLTGQDNKSLDTEYTLKGKQDNATAEQDFHSWSLNINNLSEIYNSRKDSNYVEDFIITVSIQSVKPYKSVINLDFILYSADPPMCYRLIEYSNYYELIIMAESEPEELTLYWPQGISIDNTNPLTYTDGFVQREIVKSDDGYSMKLENPLKAMGSTSIYFFKDSGNSKISVPTADKVPIKSQENTYIKNQICVTK
jgi:outer membrane receptor protein involved in Fe transport